MVNHHRKKQRTANTSVCIRALNVVLQHLMIPDLVWNISSACEYYLQKLQTQGALTVHKKELLNTLKNSEDFSVVSLPGNQVREVEWR